MGKIDSSKEKTQNKNKLSADTSRGSVRLNKSFKTPGSFENKNPKVKFADNWSRSSGNTEKQNMSSLGESTSSKQVCNFEIKKVPMMASGGCGGGIKPPDSVNASSSSGLITNRSSNNPRANEMRVICYDNSEKSMSTHIKFSETPTVGAKAGGASQTSTQVVSVIASTPMNGLMKKDLRAERPLERRKPFKFEDGFSLDKIFISNTELTKRCNSCKYEWVSENTWKDKDQKCLDCKSKSRSRGSTDSSFTCPIDSITSYEKEKKRKKNVGVGKQSETPVFHNTSSGTVCSKSLNVPQTSDGCFGHCRIS